VLAINGRDPWDAINANAAITGSFQGLSSRQNKYVDSHVYLNLTSQISSIKVLFQLFCVFYRVCVPIGRFCTTIASFDRQCGAYCSTCWITQHRNNQRACTLFFFFFCHEALLIRIPGTVSFTFWGCIRAIY
jgi:hypothetical protein